MLAVVVVAVVLVAVIGGALVVGVAHGVVVIVTILDLR